MVESLLFFLRSSVLAQCLGFLLRCGSHRDLVLQVKGGEDLRVDQRVEQLFEVMNVVMATSASCRRARLSNKTYKVKCVCGFAAVR